MGSVDVVENDAQQIAAHVRDHVFRTSAQGPRVLAVLDNHGDTVAETGELGGVADANHRRSIHDDTIVALASFVKDVLHFIRIHKPIKARIGYFPRGEEIQGRQNCLLNRLIKRRFAYDDVAESRRIFRIQYLVLARAVKIRRNSCGLAG